MVSALDALNARLNAKQSEGLYQFLLAKCWQLSGLEGDGRTLRYVWRVKGFLAPRWPGEPYQPIKLPAFSSRESAEIALAGIRRRVAFASVERMRPRGAYDPSKGLAFATYSHRLLTLRVADWYRSDPEFGDSRYGGGRRDESLEELGERSRRERGRNDDTAADRHMPGARLEFVDDLNRHAYQSSLEEVLTGETIHPGGALAVA